MLNLKLIRVICLRELKELFSDPMLYILATLFSFIMGWVFYGLLANNQYLTDTSMTKGVLRPVLGYINFLLMMFIPILSMKSFSGEFKEHTIALYQMEKIAWINLYGGKFIAFFWGAIFIILPTLIFPLELAFSGYSDWGVVIANYVGIICTIVAYLAIGMFSSALTSNMIVAVILSFSLLFGSILLAMSASVMDNYFVAQMIAYLSFISHLQGFELGVIRNFDLFFYLSVVIFFAYLTVRSLDMRKL